MQEDFVHGKPAAELRDFSDEYTQGINRDASLTTVDPATGEPALSDDDLSYVFRLKRHLREPFAEFLGTLILVTFGDGVVAQKVLSDNEFGSVLAIDLSWGIAVAFGFWVSGGISGGHLNPAVSVNSAIFRGFPWRKVPIYIAAQLLGGFLAAFIVYGTYKSAFDHFEGHGIRTASATGGIFCTFPAGDFLKTGAQVVSELVASALLQLGIFALTDEKNFPAKDMLPFGLWLLIYEIGSCFGWQTGFALNMARDFPPRVAAVILGFGGGMFSIGDYYFWVPIVIPFVGCFLGGLIYDTLIYAGVDSPVNQAYFGIPFLQRRFGNRRVGEKTAYSA